jgi:hypothetical protein
MSQEPKNPSRESNVREYFVRKTLIYVEGNTDKEYFKQIQLFNRQLTEIRIPNEAVKNNKIDIEKQIFNLEEPTNAIGIVDKDIDQKKKYESLFYTDYYDLEMTIFWFSNKVDLFNNLLNYCRGKIDNISKTDFDKVLYRTFIITALMGRLRLWLKNENYKANVDRIPTEIKANLPNYLKTQTEVPYFEILKSSRYFFETLYKHKLFDEDFNNELKLFLKTYFKFLGFQYWHLMEKEISDFLNKYSTNVDDLSHFSRNDAVFHYCNSHVFVEMFVRGLIHSTESILTDEQITELRFSIERKIRFSLNKEELMVSNLIKNIQIWEQKYGKKLIFGY